MHAYLPTLYQHCEIEQIGAFPSNCRAMFAAVDISAQHAAWHWARGCKKIAHPQSLSFILIGPAKASLLRDANLLLTQEAGGEAGITFAALSFAVGPLIGRYCGTKMPSDIRSTTGVLSLTFHTDLAVAKDGFSAQYYLIQQEVPESKLGMWECVLVSHVARFTQVLPLQECGRQKRVQGLISRWQ